jgi:hypothetical protein
MCGNAHIPFIALIKEHNRSYLAISHSRAAQKLVNVISKRFWRLSQNSGGSVKSPQHIALNEPIRNNRTACQQNLFSIIVKVAADMADSVK